MNLFIDSNILIDVLVQRKPFYTDAAKIWALVERGKVNASISAISFDNIHYIIKKTNGKNKAKKSVRILRDVFEIVTVDSQIINKAIDSSEISDFEDAIQYYCALRCKARYIITRNKKDFPEQKPPPISSEEFLALSQVKRLLNNMI